MRGFLLCVIAAGLQGGCGCSETGIEGNTGIDGDAPTDNPSWEPAIDGLGEPGWRDSVGPWCDHPLGDYVGFDVWSDSRGVFVLGAQYYYPPETSETTVIRIQFNDGTGWRFYLEEDLGLTECEAGVSSCGLRCITGIDGGTLFGWGGFTLATIEDGTVAKLAEEIREVFAVHDGLAYAIPNSDPRLHWWNGSEWGPFPGDAPPYGMDTIWASESCIFGAGHEGLVQYWAGESWIVQDTRTTENVTAIWGFDCDDVWAGTESGAIHHYTSVSGWETMEAPVLGAFGTTEIEGMWGGDGVLFFHSRYQFTSWNGSGFDVLGYWPPTAESAGIEISAIWGNSSDEVFLAVLDPENTGSECGDQYLLWWDGTSFRWF